jgi:hypothetical protein
MHWQIRRLGEQVHAAQAVRGAACPLFHRGLGYAAFVTGIVHCKVMTGLSRYIKQGAWPIMPKS